MINYRVSYQFPHRHFIDFEMRTGPCSDQSLLVQLPSWRPGRYELGDFAKNIRAFVVTDEQGRELKFKKRTKDLWEVLGCQGKSVHISYSFYANELNAGSSYLDDEQIYMNPVNCFLYLPDYPELPYQVELDLPDTYEVATGMENEGHQLKAKDFQQLFDCPIMASSNLQHREYKYEDCLYHIWIQGEHQLDMKRFVDDHLAFTKSQVEAFGDIPCQEYHFMYQFPSRPARHGVEHCNSTVIAMGPGNALHLGKQYEELIGISCHELYHTWNIKSIRPAEMMPYNFARENYSELGYVAEGVTTYFGDQFLWRSGVFDQDEFFSRMSTAINRHIQNPGRKNLSVAESSFDTWLDGYSVGIPWRKVSIYNEGLLIAWICDLQIISATAGNRSLDDAMKLMYQRFGKTAIGYNSNDYRQCLEEVSGLTFQKLFDDLVFGIEDYLPHLIEALNAVGVELKFVENSKNYAKDYGFLVDDRRKVVAVEPGSPADQAGIWFGDQIINVNDKKISMSLVHSINSEDDSPICLGVYRHGDYLEIPLKSDGNQYYPQAELQLTNPSSSLFSAWKRGS